jgi:hypothetical protein
MCKYQVDSAKENCQFALFKIKIFHSQHNLCIPLQRVPLKTRPLSRRNPEIGPVLSGTLCVKYLLHISALKLAIRQGSKKHETRGICQELLRVLCNGTSRTKEV